MVDIKIKSLNKEHEYVRGRNFCKVMFIHYWEELRVLNNQENR